MGTRETVESRKNAAKKLFKVTCAWAGEQYVPLVEPPECFYGRRRLKVAPPPSPEVVSAVPALPGFTFGLIPVAVVSGAFFLFGGCLLRRYLRRRRTSPALDDDEPDLELGPTDE